MNPVYIALLLPGLGPGPLSGQPTRGCILNQTKTTTKPKNLLLSPPSSHPMLITLWLAVILHIHHPPWIFMAGLSTGLAHAVTLLSSHALLPCCAWGTLCPGARSPHLLQSFCCLSCKDSGALGWDLNIQFGAFSVQSFALCMPASWRSLY